MPLKYPTTSKTLLDRIAAGDEISWDEFYERYGGIVRALAQLKGLDEAGADDICQQVMLQFFKQSKTFKFDPDVARFRTYFGLIIKTRIADHFRRKAELPVGELPEGPDEEQTDEPFLNEWRKMILKEAERELRNRVAPETFQAYELYAVQNRPVEKVASFLNCSVNQVYQAKKRCFAMLREILLKMKEQDPDLELELRNYGI